MPERIILWDVDGTIAKESLERQFVRYLLTTNRLTMWRLVTRTIRLGFRGFRFRWLNAKLGYLAGDRAVDIELMSRRWFKESVIPSLYDGMADLIRVQSASGARQVLLTGTPGFLAAPLAQYLGIADVISATPEISNGRFTGALTQPQPAGRMKKQRAKEWLSANNYEWSQVTALANHHADSHLLKAVATPIAVNPTARLRACAQRYDWPTVDGQDLVSQLSILLQPATAKDH